MPSPEIKEWIGLFKDTLLGGAALVTSVVAIYGARLWKRELAGKEIYAAAKVLVREAHLVARACNRARRPIEAHERKNFTTLEVKNTTANERWQISEVEAYKVRVSELSDAIDRYQSALLELRTLVGSKIQIAHLPFARLMTDSIHRIGNYLAVLQDFDVIAFPDSPAVIEAQRELYPSENLDDELTQKIAEAREAFESSLLPFLHRGSIHG